MVCTSRINFLKTLTCTWLCQDQNQENYIVTRYVEISKAISVTIVEVGTADKVENGLDLTDHGYIFQDQKNVNYSDANFKRCRHTAYSIKTYYTFFCIKRHDKKKTE